MSALIRGELTVQTVKSIATGVAAVAAIGATAVGVTSIAAVSGTTQVQLSAVGAPYGPASPASGWYPQPQDPPPAPGANMPTAAQLSGLLSSLTDPSVSFANKGNMVQGGITGMQAHIADGELKKAQKDGELPLTFNVTNIQPGAPDSATADVAFSGPKLTNPVTQNVAFVNQGSWMLSRASAIQLVQLLRTAGY